MPVVSAGNLTKLRTTRHSTLLRLAVYHPAVLWTARIDGTQTTGDTTITVKSVVQTKAPFKNCLVTFGSTPLTADYGTARWRSYSAPTLIVSAHDSLLVDDGYITVWEEIKPSSIHPIIDDNDVVYEDGNIAYTNENTQYMPIARMGAPAVAFRDSVTGLATVNFYSRASAYGGATVASHAWVFPSGTPATSAIAGTAGAPIAVTWNTFGQYYVSYTVTDSNGKTHTTYRPVFVLNHDASVGYYTQIEVSGIEGDVESGVWQTSITVWTDANGQDFPDNALCVLFAEDRYGDTEGSIGNELYRENIAMVGYIRSGSVRKNTFTGSVEFAVESVSGVMDNLWCLAGGLETTSGDTTPGWHVLDSMTYELAAHHVLTQHSTITQIADCYINPQSYTIEYIDLTDASLMENLRQVIAAVRGRLGCTAQGSLYLETNPQLLAVASRSVAYTLTTTLADMRDEIDLGDGAMEHQVSQVDFCGDDANADPVFSLAPPSPWPDGHSERIDGIRVTNQAEANQLAGLYEGYHNNPYGDVVIQWRGNYRVFDIFPSEPLAVTITAAQNARGLVWTAQRCWVKRVSMEYRAGILLVTTNVEKDTTGVLGVAGDYPADPPDPPTPPVPPVQPPIVVPPAPPVIPAGDGSRVYVATDVGVAICSNFLTTPTWTALNTGLSGDGLDVYEFKFDPWSSSGVTLTSGFIVCKNGIWKNTGLPAGSWTQVLTSAAVQALTGNGSAVNWGRGLILPTNTQNFIGIWVNQTNGGAYRYYWLYSTDAGATWNANTTNTIDSNHDPHTQGYDANIDVWPSHKTAGTLYATVSTATGGGGELDRYYKTTNNGVTWTKISNLKYTASGTGDYGGGLPKGNVMPYANGSGTPYANDLRCWGIHNTDEIRYTAAFPGYVAFDTDDWTLSLDSGSRLTFIDMCTWDEDYIYACSAPAGTGSDGKIHYTNNGGVSWSNHTWAIANSKSYCLSALPYNALFCTVAGPACVADGYLSVGIELTVDGGPSWSDHTGDLKTVLSGIRGIRSITPDWIKVT